MLKGKGIWINIIRTCDGGDLDLIADRISQNFDTCLIKITHNSSGYNYVDGVDLAKGLIDRLLSTDVEIWGWGAVHPNYNNNDRILYRMSVLPGLAGFIVDAEMAWFDAPDARARELMEPLQNQGYLLGLTTFRWPSYQSTFPWDGFAGEYFDVQLPQIYWMEAHNVEDQIDKCLEEYAEVYPGIPVIPALPAYTDSNGWRPEPGEITRAWDHLKLRGIEGGHFWDYDYARRDMTLWNEVVALGPLTTDPGGTDPDLEELENKVSAIQRDLVRVRELFAPIADDIEANRQGWTSNKAGLEDQGRRLDMLFQDVVEVSDNVKQHSRNLLALSQMVSDQTNNLGARIDGIEADLGDVPALGATVEDLAKKLLQAVDLLSAHAVDHEALVISDLTWRHRWRWLWTGSPYPKGHAPENE